MTIEFENKSIFIFFTFSLSVLIFFRLLIFFLHLELNLNVYNFFTPANFPVYFRQNISSYKELALFVIFALQKYN